LSHLGGVAGALSRAGGPKIQSDSDAYVAKNGSLSVGHAVLMPGHSLLAQYVIHTAGPVVRRDTPTPQQETDLSSAVSSSLHLAAKQGVTSTALPCISTGVAGFPLARACHIIVDTCRRFALHPPEGSPLTSIVVVALASDRVAAVQECLGRIEGSQRRDRQERERQERERQTQRAMALEAERQYKERERARLEVERQQREREKLVRERAEAAMRDTQRMERERERLAAEKETARLAAVQKERERQTALRLEAERQHAERERLDRERAERERLMREKLMREKAERERVDKERDQRERDRMEAEMAASLRGERERVRQETHETRRQPEVKRDGAERVRTGTRERERESTTRGRADVVQGGHAMDRQRTGRERGGEPTQRPLPPRHLPAPVSPTPSSAPVSAPTSSARVVATTAPVPAATVTQSHQPESRSRVAESRSTRPSLRSRVGTFVTQRFTGRSPTPASLSGADPQSSPVPVRSTASASTETPIQGPPPTSLPSPTVQGSSTTATAPSPAATVPVVSPSPSKRVSLTPIKREREDTVPKTPKVHVYYIAIISPSGTSYLRH
ncbi:hypothetical protein KIPB_011461, partial [Kipferlia bialata]